MDVVSEIRKNLLKDKHQLKATFTRVKSKESLSNLLLLSNHNAIRKQFCKFWGSPFPESFDITDSSFPTYFTDDLASEWKHLIASCIIFKKELNEFYEKKVQFESYILDMDLHRAKETIEYIQSKFGESLWLIDAKLLIAELEGGTESNWSLLAEISRDKKDTFVRFIIDSISKKHESKVSHDDYFKTTFEQINSFPFSTQIKHFLSLVLSLNIKVDPSSLPLITFFYSGFSVIDRFLAVISISEFCHKCYDREDINILLYQLRNFNKHFPGIHVVKNILLIESQVQFSADSLDSTHLQFLEKKYQGHTYESFQVLAEALDEKFSIKYIVDLYKLYPDKTTEILNIYPNESFKREINCLINDIIAKNQHFNHSLNKAQKLLLRLSSFEVVTYLEFFITREFWAVDADPHFDLINVISRDKISIDSLFEVKSKDISVFVSTYLENVKPFNKTYNFYSTLYKKNVDEVISLQGVSSDIDFYIASIALDSKEYINAEKIHEKISNGESNYFKALSLIGLIDTYVATENTRSLVALVGEIIINNINYLKRISLKSIVQIIEDSDFANVDDLLLTPIIFATAESEPHDTYIALDTVLSNLNFNKPSDIIVNQEEFDKIQIQYLLLKVCVINVLKYFTFFENIQEVESERLGILKYLSENQNVKSEEVISEIVELSQKDIIRRGYKNYNSGKISLNVFQLRKYLIENVSKSFSRFKHQNQFTKDSDYQSIDYDMVSEEYRVIVDHQNLGLINKLVSFKDPSFISFKLIMNEVREVFLFSKEYGLDGYLSTRIRHGVLINHIKKVFLPLNILTRRSGEEFEDIEYWKSYFNDENSDLQKILQSSLKKFSSEVDKYCNILRSEFMQIKTEKTSNKENALFDFRYSKDAYVQIFALLKDQDIQTLDFVELLLDLLIQHTEVQLKEVRAFFNNAVDMHIRRLIEDLKHDLSPVLIKIPIIELSNNINQAATNISNELKVISNWFYLAQEDSTFKLRLQEIIQISIKLSNILHPQFQLNPQILEPNPIKVGYSLSFIDLLKILNDNAIMHSGCSPENIDLKITADLNKERKFLRINLEHNLSGSKVVEDVRAVLNEYKSNWNNKSFYGNRISDEGGSGLKKIKRILEYDFQTLNEFDFSISDNRLSIIVGFQISIF